MMLLQLIHSQGDRQFQAGRPVGSIPNSAELPDTIHSRESPSVEKLVEIPSYEPTNGVSSATRMHTTETISLPITTAIHSQQTKPNGEKNITDIKTESEVVSSGSRKVKTADTHTQGTKPITSQDVDGNYGLSFDGHKHPDNSQRFVDGNPLTPPTHKVNGTPLMHPLILLATSVAM
jgi:hypothetical protein